MGSENVADIIGVISSTESLSGTISDTESMTGSLASTEELTGTIAQATQSTSYHPDLSGRDVADQHPIGSITSLQQELSERPKTTDTISDSFIELLN